jgi:uncharacterized metal-binding protein
VRSKETEKSLHHPPYHIIATEEGIEKNGMADPKFDEIETLIAAVRKAVRQ